MVRRAHVGFTLGALLLICVPVLAQISPGELSTAHAALEGLGNCTACHELGKAVVNDRCLACHTEVRSRIQAGTGFHAPLAGRRCVECHKEHHGRSFALIRFDRNAFDHARLGFPLQGTHARIPCERCHRTEFRTSRDVRQNTALLASATSFLGLSRACLDCHRDVHRGELSTACQQCHGFDSWKPPVAFSHDHTRFRLTGRHIAVDCVRCHPVPAAGGPPVYARIDASRCSACHRDPHAGRFQKPCSSCHTTDGWSSGTARGFDHGATRFPLRGAHRTVPCARCHPSGRFAIEKFGRCADCHADVHRGEFSRRTGAGACETCHSENGFTPATFDHSTSAFSLEGKHRTVACERCHPSKAAFRAGNGTLDFRRVTFERCSDCHQDAHAGQLAARSDGGDCGACHTVNGFLPTTFSLDAHTRTRFPLSGAHAALSCATCHPSGAVQARSSRRLRWQQTPVCETCHTDVHRAQFAGRYGCSDCHATTAWTTLHFDHGRTRFPLTGRHSVVACGACHKPTPPGSVRFAGTPMRCTDCHDATTLKTSQ